MTAEFPNYDKSMVTQHKKNTWTVKSYVDSQNKFGAIIRTRYRAELTYLGDRKWQLLNIEFFE